MNWIVETKGRVWEGTGAKNAAITARCKAMSQQTGTLWRFVRVNQSAFDKNHYPAFSELLADENPPPLLLSDATNQ